MRWLKKIVLSAAGLFVLTVIVLVVYTSLHQDRISSSLIRKVNESVNTKISYGGLRITVFESFPNITARFSDLLVSPSPFYDKTQFPYDNNDTLLYASSLSLTVSLPSLLTGTVAVRSITVRDGEVNLLTDKRGDINYKVIEGSKGDGKNIRLRNISARNVKTVWNDRGAAMRMSGTLNDASLGGEIFRTGIYLNTALSAVLDSASIKGVTVRKVPVNAGVRLRKSASSLSVTRGSLKLADLDFGIDGNINYSSSGINLTVTGKKISIGSLLSLVPEGSGIFAGDISPAGILNLICTISGYYGEAGKPHIELSYDLSDGRMSSLSGAFRVNSLELRGSLSNGDLNSAETFLMTVDRLEASYGSALMKGSFMLNNLKKPHITLDLEGDLDFDDLGRLNKNGFMHQQTGSVAGRIHLSGCLPDSARFSSTALPALKPDISLIFSDFGGVFGTQETALSDMNGTVRIGNDLVADSLSFAFGDQHFIINATLRNFIPWIAGLPGIMHITGDVHTDRFVTAMFAGRDDDTTRMEGKKMNIFPPDVTAEVKLTADSLFFMGSRAADFSSMLDYSPYVYNFNNIKAAGLEGTLTGELMLGKQKEGDYIAKAQLEAGGIDINQAFRAFDNFGQSFIVSENLQGKLTGTVTLLTPLDSTYRIITPSLVAETHVVIAGGRLVDFGPVSSLSSYLDLDELKDISFSKMENDLFINNSSVSIPKMLINSSAINFTLYGTHNFNGDYSYHVRLLLSEVLSRKARDRNRGVSAFGQVQVDGSGKATIPLKIVCTGDVIDIGYDFGQAQDNIKTDIALEKQELKGILNEEYGWYRSDTMKTRPAETKPRFTITWEEGKEARPAPEEKQKDVTESPIRILLRKKKYP
jgi:hypothetical protein